MTERATAFDVVIVNWNTGDHLRHCIESLQRAEQLQSVIVVDNASTDDSLDRASEALSKLPSTIIENNSNVGFGRACNQGAWAGSGRFVVFVNPDTRVSPDSLAKVARFFDSPAGQTFGLCGVRMLDGEGKDTISGGPFPSFRLVLGDVTRLNRVAPRLFPARHATPKQGDGPVDHVIGAFLAIRRGVFESVGGFDERYFMYYEEVDLCLRSRDEGWGTYHLDGGDVVHVGNVSSQQIRGRRLFYSLRSRRQYAARHWSAPEQRALLVTEFGVELPARMVAEMLQSRTFWPKETIEGYSRYGRALRRRQLKQPESD